MDNADLYHSANDLQRRDADDVIGEYIHRIDWRRDGRDRILDVGCGDGNVMVELLMKRLPKEYESITGVDISPKMIKYARLLYNSAKIDFQVMDISGKLCPDHVEKYDHIFSFNCLHWVQDQKTALANIYAMMKHGGDCILTFGAKNLIYDVYKILAKNPKWEPYMRDVKKYISPYHESSNPADDLKRYLHMAGFRTVNVEYKQKMFYFSNVHILKKSVFAVNPFLERMPSSVHDDYFNDYIQHVKDFGLIEENNNNFGENVRIKSPYYSLIVNAIK